LVHQHALLDAKPGAESRVAGRDVDAARLGTAQRVRCRAAAGYVLTVLEDDRRAVEVVPASLPELKGGFDRTLEAGGKVSAARERRWRIPDDGNAAHGKVWPSGFASNRQEHRPKGAPREAAHGIPPTNQL